MKQKLLLLNIVLLILVLLVGCTAAGDPQETKDSANGDVPAPETAEATDESGDTAETEGEDYFEVNRIETVAPDTSKVPDMAITDLGYDIYQLPEDQDWGYRYGVTYLYNDDGSVDAYFACVGTISGEWDWISYRHSPDGGKTWTPEKIVLTPTRGSMDHFSNCDPGVVYFNGYYYLGYTSTLNETGACNNVFVARSKSPDGPFEKWNGSGWGGYEPRPIFYYNESYHTFGMGEPSFVELNGTLYIYYTNAAPSGEYTMVATADATDENWPATIRHHGVATKKSTDSLDVKYVEEWGKFIGIATGSRMGPASWLAVYESNDGLDFTLVDAVREGTLTHLHNAGISSRPNGHIRLSEDADKLRVIYAHGEGWGTWNTRVQSISLALSDGNDLNAERAKPCLTEPFVRGEAIPKADRHVAMIRPSQDVYSYQLSRKSFSLRLYTYDAYFEESSVKVGTEGFTFKVHDESVCTVDSSNFKVSLHGVGTTAVEVRYGDLVCLFFVRVTEEREGGIPSIPKELTPVSDTYTIFIGERSVYRPQLRVRMTWQDDSFTEFYVTDSSETVTFTDYDPSIISVNDVGIVTALAAGETTVKVSCKGKTCDVRVVVSDKPEDGFYLMGDELVDLDYTDLDFSMAGTVSAIAFTNSATVSYDAAEGALKAQVTGEDALFHLSFGQAIPTVKAEDYKAIEITYQCSPDTSAKATELQLFLCVGSVKDPDPACQVKQTLIKDGEYHTLTFDVSALSYWSGDVNLIRVDFFDQSTVGDTMFIKSIKLIEK